MELSWGLVWCPSTNLESASCDSRKIIFPEKVLQLIADMRVKLKAMHKVVRREMAAVRRCDQIVAGARHD